MLGRDAEDLVSDCAEVLTRDEELLKTDLVEVCSDYPVQVLGLLLGHEGNIAEEVQSWPNLQRMKDPASDQILDSSHRIADMQFEVVASSCSQFLPEL